MTRKILSLVFYILVVGFLVAFATTLDLTAIFSFEIDWFLIALASLVAIAARFIFALIWRVLLSGMGAEIDQKLSAELLAVYAKAWLGRYLPVSAGWVIGKIYFASNLGITKTKLAVSSLMEAMQQLVIVMSLASLLLLFDPTIAELAGGYQVLLVIVSIIGLISIAPKVFNSVVSFTHKIIRKKAINTDELLDSKTVLKTSGLFFITSILNALSLLLVAVSFDVDLVSNGFLILGISALASALSILVVIAPAGLGVREGILIIGLSLIVSGELALAITVMMRLMSVIWDLIFYLLARLGK